ncbi:MAG: ABC transporter ATP-binding protein [Candidatus Tumulicola sp.]
MTGATAIVFDDVTMSYDASGSAEPILEHVSFSVQQGEFFVLVGPSGSGKSSLLKLVSGIALPAAGRVLDDEGIAVRAPSAKRGMVFQSVDGPLFDWLTVRDNVAFGPRVAGRSRAEQLTIAQRYLDLVGLATHETKYPHELSGGMKQRVQIARTLAADPRTVLMDEPFAALDAQTRRVLQREIARIWRETGKSFVYVTHDIREAVLLGQRIAVLGRGPRANVQRIYEIPLEYPRDELDPRFAELVKQLEADIEREAGFQWSSI